MKKIFIINNTTDSLFLDTKELSKNYNLIQLSISDLPVIDIHQGAIVITDSGNLDDIQSQIILCLHKKCCGIIIIGQNYNINKISFYINSGANYYLNTPTDLILLKPYVERIFNTIKNSFWILDLKRLTLTNPDSSILRLGRIDSKILSILVHNIGEICGSEKFNIALDLYSSANPKSKLQTTISRLKYKLYGFDSRIQIVNYPNEGYMLIYLPINVIM